MVLVNIAIPIRVLSIATFYVSSSRRIGRELNQEPKKKPGEGLKVFLITLSGLDDITRIEFEQSLTIVLDVIFRPGKLYLASFAIRELGSKIQQSYEIKGT